MLRAILIGVALVAAALAVTTASLADGKPPADVVQAIRMTVRTPPNIQVQGAVPVHYAFPTETVCFPDRNVVCKLVGRSLLELLAGVAQVQGADARLDEKLCMTVADLAKKPKTDLPSDLTIEKIEVPGALARKAYALAELNQMRDEMMHDIAKQGIDAGVLHVKK